MASPFNIAWALLKTDFRLPSEFREGDLPGATEFDPASNQVMGSYLYPHLNPDLEDDPTETTRRIIHEDMHAATLPEVYGEGDRHDHIEFPARLGEEVYAHQLASQGKPSWKKYGPYSNPDGSFRQDTGLDTMVSQAMREVGQGHGNEGHSSVEADRAQAAYQRYLDRVQGRA
tara:strand:- start:2811 stop:3329 length:519 start_codon:yes stop_codon:yes gene_type:complete